MPASPNCLYTLIANSTFIISMALPLSASQNCLRSSSNATSHADSSFSSTSAYNRKHLFFANNKTNHMYTYLAKSVAQELLIFFLLQLRRATRRICIPFAHSCVSNRYHSMFSTQKCWFQKCFVPAGTSLSKYGWAMVVRIPATVWQVMDPPIESRGKLPGTNSVLSALRATSPSEDTVMGPSLINSGPLILVLAYT